MALEQNHCTFVAEIGGVVRDLKQTTPDDQESQVIDRQPLVFRQPVTFAVLMGDDKTPGKLFLPAAARMSRME